VDDRDRVAERGVVDVPDVVHADTELAGRLGGEVEGQSLAASATCCSVQVEVAVLKTPMPRPMVMVSVGDSFVMVAVTAPA
jgi:glycerate-2-kinase